MNNTLPESWYILTGIHSVVAELPFAATSETDYESLLSNLKDLGELYRNQLREENEI